MLCMFIGRIIISIYHSLCPNAVAINIGLFTLSKHFVTCKKLLAIWSLDFTLWGTIRATTVNAFLFFLRIQSILYIYIYIYIYILYRFQNVFLRCPTPRLRCFLSSHWPSFRFVSFMAFLIPSIQFFFSVFLVLSFVSASTSMLFWVNFLLPFSEHGRTM